MILLPKWHSHPPVSANVDWSDPLTKKLVAVIDSRTGQNLIRPGSPTIVGTKLKPLRDRLYRGFGSNYGVGDTDVITSSFFAAPELYAPRSYFFRYLAFSRGGGTFGRILHKGGAGNGSEDIYAANQLNCFAYQRNDNGVARYCDIAIPWGTIGVPHSMAVSVSGNPFVSAAYLDGVSESTSGSDSGGGVAPSDSQPYEIGNRAYDKTRVWDGMIGCLFVWDRMLSPEDARALNANEWRMFQPSRRIWTLATAVPPAALTADLSVTLDSVGSASAGSLGLAASEVATLASVTATIAGALSTQAASSTALDSVQLVSTATLDSVPLDDRTADENVTLEATTIDSAGALALTANSALNLADVTTLSAASASIAASIAAQINTAIIGLASTLDSADLNVSLADVGLESSGNLGASQITADATLNLANVAPISAATVQTQAAVVKTLESVGLAGAVANQLATVLVRTLDDVAIQATAVLGIMRSADANLQLADVTGSASASLGLAAIASNTFDVSLVASATLVTGASQSAALDDVTVESTALIYSGLLIEADIVLDDVTTVGIAFVLPLPTPVDVNLDNGLNQAMLRASNLGYDLGKRLDSESDSLNASLRLRGLL